MSSELACVYAALVLADDEIDITGEKIATILKAAKVTVEPFWPGLFAKALSGSDVKGLITTVGSGVGSGPAAGGAAAPASLGNREWSVLLGPTGSEGGEPGHEEVESG